MICDEDITDSRADGGGGSGVADPPLFKPLITNSAFENSCSIIINYNNNNFNNNNIFKKLFFNNNFRKINKFCVINDFPVENSKV